MEYRIFIVQHPNCNDRVYFENQFKKFLVMHQHEANSIRLIYIGEDDDNVLTKHVVQKYNASTFHITGNLNDEANIDIMIRQAKAAQTRPEIKLFCLICTCNGEMPIGFEMMESAFKKIGVNVLFLDVPSVGQFNKQIVENINNSTLPVQESVKETANKKKRRKQTPVTPKFKRKYNPRWDMFIGVPLSELKYDKFKEIPFIPSDEQLTFLKHAKDHDNVLIKSHVGGGKTTTLKHFCDSLSSNTSCLYLMFNKTVKTDILDEIQKPNVLVTGYHGLASRILRANNIALNLPNNDRKYDIMIETVVNNPSIKMPSYNVIVIDEYQDLDVISAKFLWKLTHANPNAQIVVAGGMEQQNRAASMLNPKTFIETILGPNAQTVEFSTSYRLPESASKSLSYVWGENIVGINNTAKVAYTHKIDEVVNLLGEYEPQDVLCIGCPNGWAMNTLIKRLQKKFPNKYNNDTMYVSTYKYDYQLMSHKNKAIFTTYDSCKGLERNVSVILDFNVNHFTNRLASNFSREIIRNLFCVAMTRGKFLNIYVGDYRSPYLSLDDFDNMVTIPSDKTRLNISSLLDDTYKESITNIMQYLECKKEVIQDTSVIDIIQPNIGVDLHACAGNYQELAFFNTYSTFNEAVWYHFTESDWREFKSRDVEQQILMLAYKNTHQKEYLNIQSFIDQKKSKELLQRLGTRLSRRDDCQVRCNIKLNETIGCVGRADAVKNDTVYELKYVNQLRQTYFVQCAMYMLALNKEKGVLWNTKNNEVYHIKIKDKSKFIQAVISAIEHERTYAEFQPLQRSSYIATIQQKDESNSYDIAIFNEDTGHCVHTQHYIHQNHDIDYTVINNKKKLSALEQNIVAMNNDAYASSKKLPIKQFHDYSVNKIFFVNNSNNILTNVLSDYKLFDVTTLVNTDETKNTVQTQILTLLQNNTDIAKYQIRHHIYTDALQLQSNERVTHPIFGNGTIKNCYHKYANKNEMLYTVVFDDDYYGTIDITNSGTLKRISE